MSEVLSFGQIASRFASEWVLVEEPQTDKYDQIVAGRVVFHSKDRDEVYQRAIDLRLKHSALLYTGKLPEGTAIAL